MITEQQVLVDGINQLIVNVETQYFVEDVDKYKEKFATLKNNGTILQNAFSDFTWIVRADYKELGKIARMTFNISKYPDVNTAVKCLALLMLEKGLTGIHVNNLISLLKKAINATDCFADDMVEEFEEFVYKLPAFSKKRLESIIESFFSFYPFEKIDDYIEVIDNIVNPECRVRKIPNYKSILRFDDTIKSIILGEKDEDIKLKYFPLFLWWIITGVIPMRPTEFCELAYDCNFLQNGRYWLKLPRNKVKQTSTENIIKMVDTLEINKFTYDFIEKYKAMLKPEHRSKYLISWRSYSYFCPAYSYRNITKRNPELIDNLQIRRLFKEFYEEYINDEKFISLKPGDSRHIAFCNLMLQGHNPIAIARFGGHKHLLSQVHYYLHLDSYAESFVFAMAEKIQLNKLFKQTSGNREVYRRAKVFSTYEPAEINGFLRIEKGYCTVKSPGCTDFSGCEESCWDCAYHMIDLDKRKDAEIELQKRSDKFGEVIHEQIQLLQSISKSMYMDLKHEECSFSGSERLRSTAEQLQTAMAKKIVIDSKLLEFVMED